MSSRLIAPTRSSVSYSKSHCPSCLNCPNCRLRYVCHSPSVRPKMSRHLLMQDSHRPDRNQGDNSGRPNDKKFMWRKHMTLGFKAWFSIEKCDSFFNLNEGLRVLDALLIEHHAHLHRQSCHVCLWIEESVRDTCLTGTPCTTDLVNVVFCGT